MVMVVPAITVAMVMGAAVAVAVGATVPVVSPAGIPGAVRSRVDPVSSRRLSADIPARPRSGVDPAPPGRSVAVAGMVREEEHEADVTDGARPPTLITVAMVPVPGRSASSPCWRSRTA